MIRVANDNSIELTRGDSAFIRVPIFLNNGQGDEYFLNPEDRLMLSVKRSIKDEDYAFQKCLKGENIFHLLPEDTRTLEYGSYKYDVELITKDGDIFTVIEPSNFKLLSEVTVNG